MPAAPPRLDAARLALELAGEPPPMLIDVREAHELEAGMVTGAHHIPLAEVTARADEIPRRGPVVVYCQHGVRSQRAIDALARLGFTNLVNLEGGYSAWAARQPAP